MNENIWDKSLCCFSTPLFFLEVNLFFQESFYLFSWCFAFLLSQFNLPGEKSLSITSASSLPNFCLFKLLPVASDGCSKVSRVCNKYYLFLKRIPNSYKTVWRKTVRKSSFDKWGIWKWIHPMAKLKLNSQKVMMEFAGEFQHGDEAERILGSCILFFVLEDRNLLFPALRHFCQSPWSIKDYWQSGICQFPQHLQAHCTKAMDLQVSSLFKHFLTWSLSGLSLCSRLAHDLLDLGILKAFSMSCVRFHSAVGPHFFLAFLLSPLNLEKIFLLSLTSLDRFSFSWALAFLSTFLNVSVFPLGYSCLLPPSWVFPLCVWVLPGTFCSSIEASWNFLPENFYSLTLEKVILKYQPALLDRRIL